MGLFSKVKLENTIGKDPDELSDIIKDKFRQNRWSIFAFVAFSAIATVIYVRNVQNINHLAENIDKKQVLLSELKNQNQVLNHNLIQLQSPERINQIATTKLGMVKPDKAPLIIDEND
jgi:cell division protein FtsB